MPFVSFIGNAVLFTSNAQNKSTSMTLWQFVQTRILWYLPVFSFRMWMYECVCSCLYMLFLYTFWLSLFVFLHYFCIILGFSSVNTHVSFMIRDLQKYTIHTRICMLLQNVTKRLWCVIKVTWWKSELTTSNDGEKIEHTLMWKDIITCQ